MSSGLRELCLYYCNRLSFSEVTKLAERVAGERLICEQTLWNWAQEEKARKVSAALCSEVTAAQSLPLPVMDGAVDIYDAQAEEVLLMSDAIQVKAQKPTRERMDEPKRGKKAKRVKAPTFCSSKAKTALFAIFARGSEEEERKGRRASRK